MELKRSAKDVIDQAISENKAGEILLYILASMAALIGLFVMVWSAVIKEPMSALAGSACTALFWPAMSSARKTRKENIMLRLLEAPLSRSATAPAAAEALQKAFIDIFHDGGHQNKRNAGPPRPNLPDSWPREEEA